jgi:hypothetical protein
MIVSLSFRHAHEDEQCGQFCKWGRLFILQAMKLKTRFYISKRDCTCEPHVIGRGGEILSGCKQGAQALD